MTLGVGAGFLGAPVELCDEVGCDSSDLRMKQNCQKSETIPLLAFVQTAHFLLCPSCTLSIARYCGLVFSIWHRAQMTESWWYLFFCTAVILASFLCASVQDGLLTIPHSFVCTMDWYKIFINSFNVLGGKLSLAFWSLKLKSQENICVVSICIVKFIELMREYFYLTGDTFHILEFLLFFLGFLFYVLPGFIHNFSASVCTSCLPSSAAPPFLSSLSLSLVFLSAFSVFVLFVPPVKYSAPVLFFVSLEEGHSGCSSLCMMLPKACLGALARNYHKDIQREWYMETEFYSALMNSLGDESSHFRWMWLEVMQLS